MANVELNNKCSSNENKLGQYETKNDEKTKKLTIYMIHIFLHSIVNHHRQFIFECNLSIIIYGL